MYAAKKQNKVIALTLPVKYKNRRCGMIIHETAIHQMTVKSKFLQVPLQPTTMNQSPHHNIGCKDYGIQNVKLFIKHDSYPNLLKKCEQITIND